MSPYVDLGGIDGYYEVHGSGEPVLLLHGGFCSAETWAGQVDALATDYEVHLPERPGQGRTADRPGPISFDHMVADTVTYLDAADVRSAHVIGFSDGAITALMLALQHPDRVRSLVSISANLDPSIFDGQWDDDAEEPAEPTDQPEPESAPGESDLREAYARLSPDGAEHADVLLARLMDMWRVEPAIAVQDLARIGVPTLVMAGEADSIPTEHTLLIARGIPGASLCIVPSAGHMVIEQRPDLVNRHLLEFLHLAARPPGR